MYRQNNSVPDKKTIAEISAVNQRRNSIMANSSSSTNTGKVNVPEAREAMNRFKYEVANEIGVPLKQGYNGDLTSAQNGYVGGYMVNGMFTGRPKQNAINKRVCKRLKGSVKYTFSVFLRK